jgi:glycosyltransferase involved in cell wall biosynthesis
MLVSLIIPNYNSSLFIIETLTSIQNQTYKEFECIIVDDHSTDSSVSVIREFISLDSRFRLYIRPNNLPKGGNLCRNYGFSKSKGDFINWFDSDDVMKENFLEKKIVFFKIDTKLDLVICGGDFVDKDLNFLKKMTIYNTDNLYKEYFFWKIKIVTNSIMFRRSYLKGKEIFNVNLTRGQEFEFFTRLLFAKPKLKLILESLYLYRSHPNSITNQNTKYTPVNKKSEIFSLLQNLKINLDNDKEVSESCFRMIINLYRRAVKNNDFNNIGFIEDELNKIKIKNKKLILGSLYFFKKINFLINFVEWNKLIYRINII